MNAFYFFFKRLFYFFIVFLTFLTFFCYLFRRFWPTVLSVEPMVQYVVCLSVVCRLSSVVCNVLYCGKTVRPSQKVSEGVNVKKFIFWVAAIFLLSISPLRPPIGPFFALCIVAKRYVLAKKCLKE